MQNKLDSKAAFDYMGFVRKRDITRELLQLISLFKTMVPNLPHHDSWTRMEKVASI